MSSGRLPPALHPGELSQPICKGHPFKFENLDLNSQDRHVGMIIVPSKLFNSGLYICAPVYLSKSNKADMLGDIARPFVSPKFSLLMNQTSALDNVVQPRADQGNTQKQFYPGICLANGQDVGIDYA
jgi:hypothetical protein